MPHVDFAPASRSSSGGITPFARYFANRPEASRNAASGPGAPGNHSGVALANFQASSLETAGGPSQIRSIHFRNRSSFPAAFNRVYV